MPTIHSIPLRTELYALALIDHEKKPIRSVSHTVGVPKSTLHDNLSKYRADVAAFERTGEMSEREQVKNIIALSMECKVSSHDCATFLSRQTGREVSHQKVLSVLENAAEVASRKNDEKLMLVTGGREGEALPLSNVTAAAFDEIFQKRLPILGFADPSSSVIYLKKAVDRGEKSWTEFLEKLRSLGLDPESSITDGALGLLNAISSVFQEAVQSRDLFHVLQKLSKATRVIEGKCYGLIAAYHRAVKNPVESSDLDALQTKMDKTIAIFDALEGEIKMFRQSCYFGSDAGYKDSATTGIMIDRVVALLSCAERNGIQHDAIKAAKTYLSGAKECIIAYKANIEKIVKSQFGEIHAETVLGFICPIIECLDQIQRSYENSKRRAYWAGKLIEARRRFRLDFVDQAEVDRVIDAVAKIMIRSKKSNSLIEAINSVIRRHLVTYKSIPSWFCPLFTFYWNHHRFKRGKRRGLKPKEILTGEYFEKDWVDILVDDYPFAKTAKTSAATQPDAA